MDTLHPDRAEEAFAAVDDHAIPTRGYQLLRTVGLGGSAGSIPALQRFFEAVPPNPGMAFVVIVHLSAEHDSVLAQLLQRSTAMPVVQVTATVRVAPDHVYVIPPGKALAAMGDELRVADLLPRRGQHVAIDIFFRTLADTYGPHAVAVVLSGADGDGAIGIRRVKERGGLTIVQDPLQAEHDSMPRTAIATRQVDWILPVEAIGPRLQEFQRLEKLMSLPPGEVPGVAEDTSAGLADGALDGVLLQLRRSTGHDFGRFSRTILVRRIARRMQIQHAVDLPSYLERLRAHPGEAAELSNDLLSSSTNFFRDAPAFEALRPLLEEAFQNKGPEDTVRVWVPGCASGEEAYSIAMLLIEHAQTLTSAPRVQVFATDINDAAIQTAREGVYPLTIRADVSDARIDRFFTHDVRGLAVRQELRARVLFAVHDMLVDPPFASLDLISCRNLLISLSQEARHTALQTFHFALRLDGGLFLGTSENMPESSPLYEVLDQEHRIYRKCQTQRPKLPLALEVSTPARQALQRALQVSEGLAPIVPPPGRGEAHRKGARDVRAQGELHQRLIDRFAAPSVLVDEHGEVLHISHRAGRFLQMAGGEPTSSLLQLVHPKLRVELRAALARGRASGELVEVKEVPIEDGERLRLIDLSVSPADDILPGGHLVVFAEAAGQSQAAVGPSERQSAAEQRSLELDNELDRLRLHLGRTIEQHEATIEELKASNEELQAMNEELHAATEELEASREELQSTNEELTTVNAELKFRVDELHGTHSDLNNLVNAIVVATVFLDAALHVTFYTPAAVPLFNFIASDVGRPFTDLSQRLAYPELDEDARQVLRGLVPIEREVRDLDSKWYLSRIQPYRTLGDHIAGVVLTFTEITGYKTSQAELLESRASLQGQLRLFATMLAALPDTVCTVDRGRRIVYANPASERLFGLAGESLTGRSLAEAGCEPTLAARLDRRIQAAFESRQAVEGVEEGRCGADPARRFRYRFSPVLGEHAEPDSVVCWFGPDASSQAPLGSSA